MKNILLPAMVLWVILQSTTIDAVGQDNTARTWKDASGKFQVRAVLVEQTATSVRLRTDDGRELNVPIQRLSATDQEHLRALNAPADNPFAGGTKVVPIPEADKNAATATGVRGTLRALPESKSAGDEMALPATGTQLDLSAEPAGPALSPDPQPEGAPIPAGTVTVTPVDAYDKVSPPVLANRSTTEFLISVGRNKSGAPQETRGRIYVVNLAKKTATLAWDRPNAVQVVGHDAASDRTLIVDKLDQFQRGGELVIVQGLLKGNGTELYRRTLPGAGKPGFAPQVSWARLLSGSHVAAIVDQGMYLWDLPAAKLIYSVQKASASEPPAFSGNEVYTAIPQGGKVAIVETATGTIRAMLPTGSTLTPGVAFHPDGIRLAVSFSNQFQIWDGATKAIVSEATTTDHLGSYPIHWLSPKLFRTQTGSTVHTELGTAIWSYNIAPSTNPIVVGNKLLTATTSQNCILVSVELPHTSAEKAIQKLSSAGDAAMLVRPGSAVAIAVEDATGGADQAEIKKSLSVAAEKAGWKVSDAGPITLVAKIGRGKTEELNFRSLGGGPRTESKASLTPFTAELEIRRGDAVLWTRKTVNRIPPILHLQEGETVQVAVKRYEKPDAGFFSLLTLPPRILKPEISEQVGGSYLQDGKWNDLNVKATRHTPGR